MNSRKLKISDLLDIRHRVKAERPLIHCITNPISINDCANAVLAVGARPIMAEHPREVCEITAAADALAVNLGNITDVRMESMLLAGHTALRRRIPSILDLVGVGCSTLRLDYAKRFLAECRPSVIKGNLSEIKALCGLPNDAKGVDAGERDSASDTEKAADLLQNLARKTGAAAMATGAADFVSDGNRTYRLENGCGMLAGITGTGCILNVLTASFLSRGNPVESAVLASAVLGIAGELAQDAAGPGSFRAALLDNLFRLPDACISEKIRCICL